MERFTNKDSTYYEKAMQRLQELENKIESRLLIELPCIQTLIDDKGILYQVYFLNLSYGENGIIDCYVFRNKAQAEARLKELRKKNE